MSEKDRFDWSDEDDFESLADEPIEGFADFEDAEDYDSMSGDMTEDLPEDLPEDAATLVEESANEATVAALAPPRKAARKTSDAGGRGISGFELGFLFSMSTLVAAAGIGSASLLAVGVNPATLWQPAKLLQWENYLNLQSNPLNILALILLGVLTLTLLCSQAVGRAANRANQRTRNAEDMLERITRLRLENESAWQDSVFKSHESASTFVAETLGAWRLQVARQKRMTGLEGEMHRLEKALADRSRPDLKGRFDNPAVGALADGMTRLLDEQEKMASELQQKHASDEEAAHNAMQVLQDARCWHHVSEQNLGRQGAALDRLAGRLDEVHATLAGSTSESEAAAIFKGFKAELDELRNASTKGPAGTSALSDLVDRSSKLAFQIAMEVARLGPRGERLVPMSQSFEDLTTEFRAVADQSGTVGSGRSGSGNTDKLNARLAELETVVRSSTGSWRQQLQQCGPAARQLAGNLAEMVKSYEPQAARLTDLGHDLSGLTGTAFDAEDLTSGSPDSPPAGVLDIVEHTPFANDEGTQNEGGIHQPADVDPFAVTPQAQVVEAPADSGFSASVGEPAADIFGRNLDRDQLPDLELETSFGLKQDEPEAAPAVAPAATEEVYDLDDFGAVEAVEDEPVYELDDLGAAPVVEEEDVYELDDLGATPMMESSGAPEEATVFDLAQFGAVALDANEQTDEEVYDLNDFGAVQLG